MNLTYVLEQLELNRQQGVLQNLVADTKNEENTGSTFEEHFLQLLIKFYKLTELKNLTPTEKKRIDSRATPKAHIYQGEGGVVVLHFPKSSPDFLIIYPDGRYLGVELKSSFGDATEPTFNAGLNDGEKVRSIFYLYYKHSTNELILRHGEQFFPKSASDALDAINEQVEALLTTLTAEYKEQLGIYSPWYPRRTKYQSNSGLWDFCPKLHAEALDLLSKV